MSGLAIAEEEEDYWLTKLLHSQCLVKVTFIAYMK